METQDQPQVPESIQSFGQETAAETIQSADMRHDHFEISHNGLGCFCEVVVSLSILEETFVSLSYSTDRRSTVVLRRRV
jgi:hypothetical protein